MKKEQAVALHAGAGVEITKDQIKKKARKS